ncbi:hypothetical protein CASFOL_019513 [Castilleja foliolosa]|uniref:Uncharacterized protein n=1 Tax=Castilleja foliolosa TaxID=1961234 RepID=A0ABD3D5U9_9LAMI
MAAQWLQVASIGFARFGSNVLGPGDSPTAIGSTLSRRRQQWSVFVQSAD